jgi:cytoskeletal protein RodZ
VTLLNDAQEEQLKEISKYLLEVRQEKSIRIEEIAAKTHIRLAFLQALEAGQFEELPEPVYVQGFIRRYGDALGLDGTALANTFTANIFPAYSNNGSQNLDRKPNIRIPLFIPYILLLVVASIGLFYILHPRLTAESQAKKQNSVPTSKQTKPLPVTDPAKQQNSVPTPSQITTPLPVASPNGTASSTVEVTLELQGKSWLQVKVDGKTEFVGNLTKGKRRTWTAKKQLTVRSGNAGAVLISVNRQQAKPLGDEGKIKEVTFTPEINSQPSTVNGQ